MDGVVLESDAEEFEIKVKRMIISRVDTQLEEESQFIVYLFDKRLF